MWATVSRRCRRPPRAPAEVATAARGAGRPRARAASGRELTTPALVLGSVAYGEADRIVTLFSRDLGKVSALGRAASKSRTRFGASLAPFVVGEAALEERHGSELYVLLRFEAREDHTGLGGDVLRLAHASYGTELVHRLTAQRQAEPTIYDLLVELYRTAVASAPSAWVLRAFELRLLEALGFAAALTRCVVCGVTDGAALDEAGATVVSERGGLACARCAASLRAGNVLCAQARRALLAVAAAPLASAPSLAGVVDAGATTRAREAMHALIAEHLTAPLRSLEFIRQLRGQA